MRVKPCVDCDELKIFGLIPSKNRYIISLNDISKVIPLLLSDKVKDNLC